jgi:hypothetical protein
MGDFDAIGDAVTGGMLARAVEPAAGEADAGHTHEKACLNCGTALVGPYCAVCGQKAHIHRSVRAFFQDFLASLFNFEGKIRRTLPMLAWHPGDITRRYIAGERARFISPVALYIFTVFAMFAVLNFTGALGGGSTKNFKEGLKTEIAETQASLAKLEVRRKADLAAGKDVADLDRKIAKRKEDIAESEMALTTNVTNVKLDPDTPSWVRPFVQNVQNNPQLASMRIQDAASKYSWLLIPISVPFMWLLFPLRRRFNTYDHAVFVTYSLSFMMMLVIAGGLFVLIGWSGVAGMLFLLPPFHMYRQLKGAYQLGRFGTWWRTILLITFAMIAGGIFFAVVAALGAA